MPSAVDTYKLYLSLKFHFTKKTYDYFKYKGNVKADENSLMKRPDKLLFYKLGKKYPKEKLIDLFVANFIHNPSSWVGSFLSDESEEIYIQWLAIIEKITYHFLEEMDEVFKWCESNNKNFNSLFEVIDNDHPIIVKMVLQNVISLESFIILNKVTKFCSKIDKKIDDPIWQDLYLKVNKYSPFLININLDNCKDSLKRKLEKEYPELICSQTKS